MVELYPLQWLPSLLLSQLRKVLVLRDIFKCELVTSPWRPQEFTWKISSSQVVSLNERWWEKTGNLCPKINGDWLPNMQTSIFKEFLTSLLNYWMKIWFRVIWKGFWPSPLSAQQWWKTSLWNAETLIIYCFILCV